MGPTRRVTHHACISKWISSEIRNAIHQRGWNMKTRVLGVLVLATICGRGVEAQLSFTGVGTLPGGGTASSSFIRGVSGDGRFAFGDGDRAPASRNTESLRWTRPGPAKTLGVVEGAGFSTATSASFDGGHAVGYHQFYPDVY